MNARLLNVEDPITETCEWIFSHEEFVQWTDDSLVSAHHGFLWIKGKPGSGKSTIMKHIHGHSTKRSSTSQMVLSYFFNARAPGKLEKSSIGLYRSLTHQLLQRLPAYKESFLERFREKKHKEKVEEWTIVELKAFIYDVLVSTEHPTVYILIDALDEGDEDDIRQMIGYLERLALATSSSSSRLRICLSSRHYPHISIRKGIIINLDEQVGHGQDISVYLRDTLCVELLPLQQKLCAKSGGIFLWIVLVVRMLNALIDQGESIRQSEELLNTLPADLNNLFEDVINRGSKNKQYFVMILQWILFSWRTISVQELYIAVHCGPGSGAGDLLAVPEEYRLRLWLLHQSRGLAEVVQSRYKEGKPGVQFIHETVRTFLLGPEGISRLSPGLRPNVEGLSHETLKEACILFRSRCNDPTIFEQSWYLGAEEWVGRFDQYTTEGPNYHAENARRCGISQERFLMKLVKSPELLELFIPYKKSLLNSLVFGHLTHLLKCFIETQIDTYPVADPFRQMFYYAIYNDDLYMARFLLENSANVCLQSTTVAIVNALPHNEHYAEMGLMLLLRHGVILSPAMLEVAVTASIKSLDGALLRALLDKGLSPNARYQTGITLLHFARMRRNRTVVNLLLERGANPSASYQYGSALYKAVVRGDEALVQKLLQEGADVNEPGGKFGSALLAARHHFDYSIEKMLLDHGARLDKDSIPHSISFN